MSAVLLFKMEVAGLALHHLLFWDPSYFPIVPLCSLSFCLIKTVSTAVFLVTVDLGIFLPTMQTGHDLGRFSGVRFPASPSTESMTQSLRFKDRSRFRMVLGVGLSDTDRVVPSPVSTDNCTQHCRRLREDCRKIPSCRRHNSWVDTSFQSFCSAICDCIPHCRFLLFDLPERFLCRRCTVSD